MNALLDKYKGYLLTEKFDEVIYKIAEDLFYYGKLYGFDTEKYQRIIKSVRMTGQMYEQLFSTEPNPEIVNFWDVNFEIKNTLRSVFAEIEWDEEINDFIIKLNDKEYYNKLRQRYGKWDKQKFLDGGTDLSYKETKIPINEPVTIEDDKKTENDAESIEWKDVLQKRDLEAVTGFLKKFPKGKFVKQANELIDRLLREDQPKEKQQDTKEKTQEEKEEDKRERQYQYYKKQGDNYFSQNKHPEALKTYEKALANKWDEVIYERVKSLKEKKKRNSGGAFRTFIIIVIIAVAGYYAYDYYQTEKVNSIVNDEVLNWWENLSPEWQQTITDFYHIPQYPTRKQLYSLLTLEYLSIDNDTLTSVEPLSNFKKCKTLNIRAPFLKDISPLRNLSELEELDISYTSVDDLSPLLDLKMLHTVYVHKEQVYEGWKEEFSNYNPNCYIYEIDIDFELPDHNELLEKYPELHDEIINQYNNDSDLTTDVSSDTSSSDSY